MKIWRANIAKRSVKMKRNNNERNMKYMWNNERKQSINISSI